jgi:NAD(P)-dependent dehydrogenase (short-subunit alcohol dehydrogenase family)
MAGIQESHIGDVTRPAPTPSELPVALVTNPDGGHGHGLILDLLDAGYRVVLTGKQASALTRHLHGLDDRVYAVAANLDDPWQVERTRELVIARFGRLDEIIAADTGEVAHAA